ncbi:acyl-CoA carboxylase subunit epsilon [Actinopolymorpha sp. NPDC004070]|uniref:acyl-CoA carboxylase subunit epsilon n=1 Tax=Actinopolymorpha sp. NPDC004070 TaxID=3154548 RepID=UPI0033B9EE28
MTGESGGTPDAGAASIDSSGMPEPVLRVVKGNPTPAEFAALVAVVTAKQRAAAAAAADDRRRGRRGAKSGWAAYWRRTSQQPARPGPGAWRASALPH